MDNEYIKQERLNAGFTQKQAAGLLGISERTLQNIESGKSVKSDQYYQYMCHVYSKFKAIFDLLKIKSERANG